MLPPLNILLIETDNEIVFYVERLALKFGENNNLQLTITTENSLLRAEEKFKEHNPNLLILCSSIATDYNFQALQPLLKENHPQLVTLLLVNEIRPALRLISVGVDYAILKGQPESEFSGDFTNALNETYKSIQHVSETYQHKNSTFYSENYPIAIYSLENDAIPLLYRDFNVFPDSENRYEATTKDFIDALGLNIMLIVGQGHTYHESCLLLPAGSSREYSTLVFSFSMDNPSAEDKRLKTGYFLICIFVKNEYSKDFPAISLMQPLIAQIKKDITDARNLANHDDVVKLKYTLLNKIKNLSQK